MTCSSCIHWTADAWQNDRGEWCTYGQKILEGGESIVKGRCDQMSADRDDKWADEPACFLYEARERQQDLFGG